MLFSWFSQKSHLDLFPWEAVIWVDPSGILHGLQASLLLIFLINSFYPVPKPFKKIASPQSLKLELSMELYLLFIFQSHYSCAQFGSNSCYYLFSSSLISLR